MLEPRRPVDLAQPLAKRGRGKRKARQILETRDRRAGVEDLVRPEQ
jgi:hypothetical protein